MPFTVQQCREDPTIDVVVADAATGRPTRMTVLSGVAAVGPDAAPGIRISTSGRQPDGEAVGFYPPGAQRIGPASEARAQAEVALAQVVVNTRIDNVHISYGVGDVAVTLVPADDGAALWPYLSFHCYGAMPLVVRYRVTILSAA